MKYYTVEEIVEALKKMIEHGWGDLVIHIVEHRIPRYEDRYSNKKEGKVDG